MHSNPILLFVLLLFSHLVSPFVCEYSPDKTDDSLLRTGLQSLGSASLRGMTSSQVIEYNPRNIALMTLLNSVLIVGGLLGTMARNDKVHPFKKRVDFSRFKKKLFPKRRNGGQQDTTPSPVAPILPPVHQPVRAPSFHHAFPSQLPPHHQMHSRPLRIVEVEHQHILPSYHSRPNEALNLPEHQHILPHYLTKPELLNLPEPFDIHPRIPDIQIIRRRADLAKDSSSSSLSDQVDPVPDECRHVLRCLDGAGKLVANPSPSELSTSALKLLNSATSAKQQQQYSSLMAKVRELIEIEERGQCFLHFTCQNVPLTGRSSAAATGRNSKAPTS